MGNYVVIPSEVDPTLTGGFDKIGTFNGPFKGADSIGAIYDTTFPEGASRNYITGFMVSRDREGPGVPNLHNAVLRYASPEDATAAADELGATTAPDANKYFGSEPPAPRPIEIPRHPDARGITFGSSESSVTVVSFLAHGPFVLTQQSYSKNGLAEALELVSGTLDKQIPLIDKFKPTPPDQIAQLPLDQDGLLARTVEPAVDRRGQFRFGLYEVHGFLTYSDDPAGDEKVLNDAGVDLIALAGTDVFRARDAEGAQTILDKWSEIRAEDSEPTDGVPGLPDSRCFKTVVSAGTDSERTHIACMFTVDRYLVDLGSFQKRAAHQKAAAQYLLLTAS
ncbi:hypothetical protein A5643_00920 [Mycobacterium sp. 1274756.6]|nr:hypothetical protein A5643_00920 [Mycobacterium sp. 1274756.6]